MISWPMTPLSYFLAGVLMFIIMGILTMIAVVVSFSYPRLRFLEDELPDMVTEEASEQ